MSDGTTTATADLSFTAVPNTAPVGVNDGPIVTAPNTNAAGNVLANDTDADGDTLTVTQFTIAGVPGGPFAAGTTATIPGVGTLVINADGSFVFDPNPAYDGPVPTATYTVSDGTTTATADLSFTDMPNEVIFEQLVTQPNPFSDALDPNRPDPFAIRSPVIPIGMPEDLFVTNSVRESAVRIAQNSNFGVFNVDAPTRGELDNLTFDLKGLPIGMDPNLFVQHAVRSLPITQEPRLFVQNAVRQSQLESTMRSIGVNSFNTATSGISSLFSPFDLGSVNDNIDLAVDGVNGEFSDKKAETNVTLPTELALDPINETVVDINALELPATKEVDVKVMVNKPIQAKLTQPAEAKKVAAASFANQLNAAAKKFKSNDIFNTH